MSERKPVITYTSSLAKPPNQATLRDVVTESLISPIKLLLEAQKAVTRACWLDGDQCPYGSPEGMFKNRPTTFCQYGVCRKITENDLTSLAGNRIEVWIMPRR